MNKQTPSAGEANDLPERFSLVAGGGFHTLLGRMGLLGEDMLPSRQAAMVLAALAFLLPGAFAVCQSLLDEAYSGWDYFADATVYARYLVAVFVMVATEHLADGRIVLMTRYFRSAELLNADQWQNFNNAVSRADRQASSYKAETVILVLAFVWSLFTTRYAAVIAPNTWEAALNAQGVSHLSWAGEASALSSNTLFLFLVLRWFWRFLIWARLLWRTSRMHLQIMPLHPDRCGGLGFLSIFPSIFSGLVFALSCVIAASFHKAVPESGATDQLIWLAMLTWLVLVVMVFLGPLLVFVRHLYFARETALLAYGQLAHGHHLDFHRKWLENSTRHRDLLGSSDPSSVSDLNASLQTVYQMRLFPIDKNALVQLLGSAALPMAALAAMQMPVGDLLKLILGVLF